MFVGFVEATLSGLDKIGLGLTSPESTPHAANRFEYPVARVSCPMLGSGLWSYVPMSSLTRPAHSMMFLDLLSLFSAKLLPASPDLAAIRSLTSLLLESGEGLLLPSVSIVDDVVRFIVQWLLLLHSTTYCA